MNEKRGTMKIAAFTSGPVATNSFLAWDEEGHGMIIDAPPDSFRSVSEVVEKEKIGIGALVLTHTHWDHTGDIHLFREAYGDEMIIYVHRDDEYRMLDPEKYLMWPIDVDLVPMKPDRYLHDKDEMILGGMKFDVIHAPGHSEGSICLYDADHHILFAGDVLFAGSVGRTDLPGGDHDTLINSIRDRLMPLPDETRVLPGHGPATTIGEERETNPFIELS